ncbi:hypothetical protein BST61_g6675 [Cercospora zeina]
MAANQRSQSTNRSGGEHPSATPLRGSVGEGGVQNLPGIIEGSDRNISGASDGPSYYPARATADFGRIQISTDEQNRAVGAGQSSLRGPDELEYKKTLKYNSITEAQASHRSGDNIVLTDGSDDISAIKNDVEMQKWIVRRLLSACLSPTYAPYPQNDKFNATEWDKWNESLKQCVRKGVFEEGSDLKAWFLLEEIFNVQEKGISAQTRTRVGKERKEDTVFEKMKCSARINKVEAVLKDWPIVANEMLGGKNLDLLAAAPELSAELKLTWKKNNMNRAKAKKANEEKGKSKEEKEKKKKKEEDEEEKAKKEGKKSTGKKSKSQKPVEEHTNEDA